ncbi:GNAT family N-acetyltransferase [Chloroflexota bacterium]
MSSSPYIIRNYHSDDFTSYVRLNVDAEKLDPIGRCTSPQVPGERLGRPNYLPEQDLFVAEVDGKIIGYMDVKSELNIGRVVLDSLIHPQHRRKGLAIELSYYAMCRARELGARVAHVDIAQANVAAKNLLSKLGFRFVRRFLELQSQLSKVHLPDVEQIPLTCCHLRPGEEEKLTQIQNHSFAETWGYNPNTIEEIIYRVNLSDCCPKDVILASEQGEPIGYCWTTMNLKEDIATGKGRIYMLGVDPDYRGRGIGKLLLLAGLSYLKSKGVAVAELTVDSQNRAACALYKSVGFEVSSSTLWYEKALD